MQKLNRLRSLDLRSYAIGYGICVAISISVLIITFLVPIYCFFAISEYLYHLCSLALC